MTTRKHGIQIVNQDGSAPQEHNMANTHRENGRLAPALLAVARSPYAVSAGDTTGYAVYDSRSVKVGELHYYQTPNGTGWRFFPHDQGLPSRKYWSAAWQAVPRRFRGALTCVPLDAIARHTDRPST